MDKGVGMVFPFVVVVVIDFLTGAAVLAFAVFPAVRQAAVADIALFMLKDGADGIGAVGAFGAVDAAPREQGGHLRDGDAVELFAEDVVKPLLQIGNLRCQSVDQALGDFAQEYARFAHRVEKARIRVLPQALRQQIQHLVGNVRRGEDFVVGKVGEAGEDVGVIVCFECARHCPAPKNASGGIHGWDRV